MVSALAEPTTAADNTRSLPARPKFNSRVTADRLREGAGLYLPPQFRTSNITRKVKVSAFKELDLDGTAWQSSTVDIGLNQGIFHGSADKT